MSKGAGVAGSSLFRERALDAGEGAVGAAVAAQDQVVRGSETGSA